MINFLLDSMITFNGIKIRIEIIVMLKSFKT